jgi:glucose-1-phosphate thymidylyltransferase
VRAIRPSARGELEITEAIQWLIDNGQPVRHQVVEGWWIDTGKLTPLLEANRLILETIESRIDGTVDADSHIEGRVIVEAGAEVVRSRIRGPAIIGERTRVVDSYIGPFSSVYHDCEILGSELDHSVVLEQSRIVNIPRVADSLIGRNVEVVRSDARPRATRLMLGDHSHVDLG